MLEAAERAGHRDRVAIALDPAASEFFDDGALPLRGPRRRRRRDGPTSTRGSSSATRSSRSRTALAEDDWDDVARADRAARRSASSSSATTSSSPTPSGCGAGSTENVANAILVKVNQIGTLTETLDTIDARARGRLRLRHVAPLRRDRGHDDRRPRRRDRRAARSRPARRRAPTASRSTTSCSGSRRSSATRRGLSGLGRVPALPVASAVRGVATLARRGRRHRLAARRSSPRSGPRCSTPEALSALVARRDGRARGSTSRTARTRSTASGRAWSARREDEVGRPLALIADLQGPKLRIGDLAAPVSLRRGEDVVVGPARRLARTASCRSARR